MLSSRAIYDLDRIAFHIFLISGKPNSVVSTLPQELLRRHLQKELFLLQNSLIVGQKMADRLLDKFSELILQDMRFEPYFYPSYLIISGVNFGTAEKLIYLQDAFAVQSGMCFTKQCNPIEFFLIQQRYLMFRNYVLRNGRYLDRFSFIDKFVVFPDSKHCFKSIDSGNCRFIDFEEEDTQMAGVVDSKGMLVMLVSV